MRRMLRDLVLPIVVAFALAFVLQAAVAKPYEIPTGSMRPTISEQDRIIANRLVYRFRDIARGDIVVFTPPASAIAACRPPAGVPFVKRAVGVAGDRVDVVNRRTLVNGREFVVPGADPPQYEAHFPVVPEGHLLLLGDNRNASCDSHLWGSSWNGAARPNDAFAPVGNVIGQAEITYWPPGRLGFLD